MQDGRISALRLASYHGILKANMFADVAIYGGPKREVLAVPAEAVIETGQRTSVVLALGDGRFQPVDVVTGMASNGRVEILSGIEAGDEVVTVANTAVPTVSAISWRLTSFLSSSMRVMTSAKRTPSAALIHAMRALKIAPGNKKAEALRAKAADRLAESPRGSELPAGTREGTNDWKRTGYGGPCPPIGRHRYFHKLYALDTTLGDLGEPTKADVERAMKGHVLAEAVLMGTYQKGD